MLIRFTVFAHESGNTPRTPAFIGARGPKAGGTLLRHWFECRLWFDIVSQSLCREAV